MINVPIGERKIIGTYLIEPFLPFPILNTMYLLVMTKEAKTNLES